MKQLIGVFSTFILLILFPLVFVAMWAIPMWGVYWIGAKYMNFMPLSYIEIYFFVVFISMAAGVNTVFDFYFKSITSTFLKNKP